MGYKRLYTKAGVLSTSLQLPAQFGWDYVYRISDSPWDKDSALWDDAARTDQIAAEGERIAVWDNAGATAPLDNLESFAGGDANGRELTVDVLNGHDGSTFGVNGTYSPDSGAGGALSGGILSQPYEMYAVITLANQATQQVFIDYDPSGGVNRALIQLVARKFSFFAGSSATLSSIPDANDGSSYLFYAKFAGNASIGRVLDSAGNDTRVTGLDAGVQDFEGLSIWAAFNTGFGTTSDAHEVGIRATASSAAEEQQLVDYAKNYYGLGA